MIWETGALRRGTRMWDRKRGRRRSRREMRADGGGGGVGVDEWKRVRRDGIRCVYSLLLRRSDVRIIVAVSLKEGSRSNMCNVPT